MTGLLGIAWLVVGLACAGTRRDAAPPVSADNAADAADAADAKENAKKDTENTENTAVSPVPAGFNRVTPQLTIRGVAEAVDFYAQALGAEEVMTLSGAQGTAIHAQIRIGGSIVMLDEENLAAGMQAPPTLGGSAATLLVYLDQVNGDDGVDAVVARFEAGGATVQEPLEDRFWGDRSATLRDPFGHRWVVASHTEELTEAAMAARMKLAMLPPESAVPGAPPAWRQIRGTPARAGRPEGYQSVTPALVVDDAVALIAFYKAAFGATERSMMIDSEGRVVHAEVELGDSVVILSDEGARAPGVAEGAEAPRSAVTLGGAAVALQIYTADVDALFARAEAAEAAVLLSPRPVFWGDRFGQVADPAGFVWGLATRTRELSVAEIEAGMRGEE